MEKLLTGEQEFKTEQFYETALNVFHYYLVCTC